MKTRMELLGEAYAAGACGGRSRTIAMLFGVTHQAVLNAARKHAPDSYKVHGHYARRRTPYFVQRCACGALIVERGKKPRNIYCSMKCPKRAPRGELAYRLRCEGMKWAQVAQELGYHTYTNAISVAWKYAEAKGLPWPGRRVRSPGAAE